MLFVVAVDVLNEFNERTTGWEIVLPPARSGHPSDRWKAQPTGSGKWQGELVKRKH